MGATGGQNWKQSKLHVYHCWAQTELLVLYIWGPCHLLAELDPFTRYIHTKLPITVPDQLVPGWEKIYIFFHTMTHPTQPN